jgi:hypothetical protein
MSPKPPARGRVRPTHTDLDAAYQAALDCIIETELWREAGRRQPDPNNTDEARRASILALYDESEANRGAILTWCAWAEAAVAGGYRYHLEAAKLILDTTKAIERGLHNAFVSSGAQDTFDQVWRKGGVGRVPAVWVSGSCDAVRAVLGSLDTPDYGAYLIRLKAEYSRLLTAIGHADQTALQGGVHFESAMPEWMVSNLSKKRLRLMRLLWGRGYVPFPKVRDELEYHDSRDPMEAILQLVKNTNADLCTHRPANSPGWEVSRKEIDGVMHWRCERIAG